MSNLLHTSLAIVGAVLIALAVVATWFVGFALGSALAPSVWQWMARHV